MKNNNTKEGRDKVSSCGKDKAARWRITQRVRYRKKMILAKLIGRLERWDSCVTGQRRKLAFFVGVLCCSGCLFYLLGNALRKPSRSFTRPFMPDSGFNRPQRAAEFLKSGKSLHDTGDGGDSASRMNLMKSMNHINFMNSLPIGNEMVYFQHIK